MTWNDTKSKQITDRKLQTISWILISYKGFIQPPLHHRSKVLKYLSFNLKFVKFMPHLTLKWKHKTM